MGIIVEQTEYNYFFIDNDKIIDENENNEDNQNNEENPQDEGDDYRYLKTSYCVYAIPPPIIQLASETSKFSTIEEAKENIVVETLKMVEHEFKMMKLESDKKTKENKEFMDSLPTMSKEFKKKMDIAERKRLEEADKKYRALFFDHRHKYKNNKKVFELGKQIKLIEEKIKLDRRATKRVERKMEKEKIEEVRKEISKDFQKSTEIVFKREEKKEEGDEENDDIQMIQEVFINNLADAIINFEKPIETNKVVNKEMKTKKPTKIEKLANKKIIMGSENWQTVKNKKERKHQDFSDTKIEFCFTENKKTEMCKFFLRNPALCKRGVECNYAHSINELAVSACFYDKNCKLVIFTKNGCENRKDKNCKFKHSTETLDSYFARIGLIEKKNEVEPSTEKIRQITPVIHGSNRRWETNSNLKTVNQLEETGAVPINKFRGWENLNKNTVPKLIIVNNSLEEETGGIWKTVTRKHKKELNVKNVEERVNNNEKTQMCLSILKGEICKYNNKCNFAHSAQELKITECIFNEKCKLCIFTENGECVNKSNSNYCKFKHSIENTDSYFLRIGVIKTPKKFVIHRIFDDEVEGEIILLKPTIVHQPKNWNDIKIVKEEEPEIPSLEIKNIVEEKIKTILCSSLSTGVVCKHKENCNFAHSVEELTVKPCLFQDRCKMIININGSCENKNNLCCQYIHSNLETLNAFYRRISIKIKNTVRGGGMETLANKNKIEEKLKKTKMCKSFGKTECKYKNSCKFAHSMEELNISECFFGMDCRLVKFLDDGICENKGSKFCSHKHPSETVENYYTRINF